MSSHSSRTNANESSEFGTLNRHKKEEKKIEHVAYDQCKNASALVHEGVFMDLSRKKCCMQSRSSKVGGALDNIFLFDCKMYLTSPSS